MWHNVSQHGCVASKYLWWLAKWLKKKLPAPAQKYILKLSVLSWHVSLPACPLKTHKHSIAAFSEANPCSTKMLCIPLLNHVIRQGHHCIFRKFVINIHIYISILVVHNRIHSSEWLSEKCKLRQSLHVCGLGCIQG